MGGFGQVARRSAQVLLAAALGVAGLAVEVPSAAAAPSVTSVSDIAVPVVGRGSSVPGEATIQATEGATFDLQAQTGSGLSVSFEACTATVAAGGSIPCTLHTEGRLTTTPSGCCVRKGTPHVHPTPGRPDRHHLDQRCCRYPYGEISLAGA